MIEGCINENISKPLRPSNKAKRKSKRQRKSKMTFSKHELIILSKTLLKLLPTNDSSMKSTESKTKEEEDELDYDVENPARYISITVIQNRE